MATTDNRGNRQCRENITRSYHRIAQSTFCNKHCRVFILGHVLLGMPGSSNTENEAHRRNNPFANQSKNNTAEQSEITFVKLLSMKAGAVSAATRNQSNSTAQFIAIIFKTCLVTILLLWVAS